MQERRRFLKRMGGLAALMALTSNKNRMEGISGITEPTVSGQIGGPFVHTVFFWLVDDSRDTKERFTTELFTFIDNVDVIKTKHVGQPADTDREVIDSTWSYSLILSFKSKKEQDLYQDHPLHKTFINNASSLWTKVQVYDSVKL